MEAVTTGRGVPGRGLGGWIHKRRKKMRGMRCSMLIKAGKVAG